MSDVADRSVSGRLLLLLVVILAMMRPDTAVALPIGANRAPTSAVSTSGAGTTDKVTMGGGDEIVTGVGDTEGYHLYAATAGDGWKWRALATIQPDRYDDERWTGRQCMTGDGRYVVVVVAPWHASNDEHGLEHGGFAYAVDAHTGVVRPVTSGVSLFYYDPGCGADGTATLTRMGDGERSAQLLTVDSRTAAVKSVVTVAGQVTSAVPAAGGIVAVRGDTIIRYSGRRARVLLRLHGQVYALRGRRTGVDFLVSDGSSKVGVWTWDGHRATQVGAGRSGLIGLYGGRAGRNHVTGTDWIRSGSGIGTLPGVRRKPEAVSLDGGVVTSGVTAAKMPAPGFLSGKDATAQAALTAASDGRALGGRLPRPASVTAAGVAVPRTDRFGVALSHGTKGNTAPRNAKSAAATTTCAVPRNDPAIQVRQPTTAEVNWAVQQAARNNLRGSTGGRPASAFNLGLGAYDPSGDFPRPQLSGADASVPIPREVLDAILVQESNWSQASWHALPGIAGNPLVADYYGADGGTVPGVVTPDCGYGIGQITDGMTAGAQDNGVQRKVAVDYLENIAAAAKILGDKWNQLAQAGVTLYGQDPTLLENWYFSVWAYNTGFHPDDGTGVYGLGWVNNPINPDYPPDRGKFLLYDNGQPRFDDASHPGSWTYPERIFGWMQVPLQDANGNRYAPSPALAYPDRTAFCDSSNDCDPSNAAAPCTRSDYECWWHKAGPAICDQSLLNPCHTGSWDVGSDSSEPIWEPTYAPCGDNVIMPQPGEASGSPIFVLDGASGLNVVGCNPTEYTDGGTFTTTFGDASHAGTDMDFHQLSAGLGGHMWFTHTAPSDPAWKVTGVWTPNHLALGTYEIQVFVPGTGATAKDADYQIYNGGGWVRHAHLDQSRHDGWTVLGTFRLTAGATVSLDNTKGDGADLAYSAIAFIPLKAGPCYGASCENQDPATIGCDATTGVTDLLDVNDTVDPWIDDPSSAPNTSIPDAPGHIEIRYAPVCDAVWLRWTPLQGQGGGQELDEYLCSPATDPGCTVYRRLFASTDGSDSRVWSPMVDLHHWVAAAVGGPVFGGPSTQID